MATNAELLAEARLAYNALVTGTMARVVVDQNGQRVEYAATNRAALYTYIQELEGKCNPGIPLGNGPAGFIF